MIQGFYYDNQLNNELLSVGLYPNTKKGAVKDGITTWDPADNLKTPG